MNSQLEMSEPSNKNVELRFSKNILKFLSECLKRMLLDRIKNAFRKLK